MKRIKQCILAVLMCSVMALPAVYAYEKENGDHHEQRGKKMHEMYAQLQLSDEQKKQLDANKQKQREQMKEIFQKMKTQREALHQALMKTDLDMNQINGIQAQIKTLQAQMMDNRLNSILEVRRILTPEQFKEFNSLMEQHRHQWVEKRGHEKRVHKPLKDKDEEVE